MAGEYHVICNHCEGRSIVRVGWGATFHILHCLRCGAEKIIRLWQTSSLKRYYNEHLEEMHPMYLEEKIEKCTCGGEYRLNAPPRCPYCKSKDLTEDPLAIGCEYN
jgi:DNA-directed RNA polymerase subunit RPC12/RpoP